MKKKYQKPTVEVIVIDSVSHLLRISGGGEGPAGWYEAPDHRSDKQLS